MYRNIKATTNISLIHNIFMTNTPHAEFSGIRSYLWYVQNKCLINITSLPCPTPIYQYPVKIKAVPEILRRYIATAYKE